MAKRIKFDSKMVENVLRHGAVMEQLFNERDETGDITFVVGSKRIRAHRLILAAASPKYKAQFYGLMRPLDGEVRVEKVSAAAFKEFLQFFYKQTVTLTAGNIEMVVDLAKQSLSEELVQNCVNFIKDKVKPYNVCEAYRLSLIYDLKSLRVDCELAISTKTNAVLSSGDFLHCAHHVLLSILKLDQLSASEIDILYACLEWARAHCKRNHLDEKNAKNLRAALKDAIYQIRFSCITAYSFAAFHKSLNGFFTPEETTELLYITNGLVDFKPRLFNFNPRKQPIRQGSAAVGWTTYSELLPIDNSDFVYLTQTSKVLSQEENRFSDYYNNYSKPSYYQYP